MYYSEGNFQLKENIIPVFKSKRGVPFAVMEAINKELNRLDTLGVILFTDYSKWAAPVEYVKN